MIKTNQPSLVRIVLQTFVCFMLFHLPSGSFVAFAQLDIVITRRNDSEQTLKRSGSIVQWKGQSLTINSSGIVREIENEQIIEVKTNWGEDYLSGLSELKTGKTQIAIVKFQESLRIEQRPWVQQIIRAKLVDAYQSIEKHGAAIEQFLQIVREDPNTRFLHLAPLPWATAGNSLNESALQWNSSPDSVTKLIGASWLLGGAERKKGITALEELSRDIDPRIKNLAIAQLWRTRVNANAKQVNAWRGIVEQMPRELRAGPYLVLAEAQARAGLVDPAIVNLMRIPILYPEQTALSAAALYRSRNLLHNRGQTDQARSLLNELITNYPQTIWAQQATQ